MLQILLDVKEVGPKEKKLTPVGIIIDGIQENHKLQPPDHKVHHQISNKV